MHPRTLLPVLVAIALCTSVRPAAAQECPCDCYFSSDCEPGNFCNWGTLSEEDSCFWRTPKPQGNPGAGCDQDYNNWGQCDGICELSEAESAYSVESLDNLTTGISLWGAALTDAARRGGGQPDAERVAAVRGLGYVEPRLADGLWRVTVEVLMLTAGSDVLRFPTSDGFRSEEALMKDLSADPALADLADLALRALLAEIRTAGSGRPFIDEIESRGLAARLDPSIYALVCRDEPTNTDCLYRRLVDMGEAIGRGGRGGVAANGFGGGCAEGPACPTDATSDLVTDVADLLFILGYWGPVANPWDRGDTNGDAMIDVTDMLAVMAAWGPC
ncbi:MAG: hypothetical protein ACYTG1_09475 [Planctomycetota bacterium]|jgi:hypothetical protein